MAKNDLNRLKVVLAEQHKNSKMVSITNGKRPCNYQQVVYQ